MYEVPGQDRMKSEILPHLPVSKRGYNLKREWEEVILCSLHKQKTACRWPITSRFHDVVAVVREQHALQPLALAAASACVFLAVAHSCGFTVSLFCLVFSKKFNIISALSSTNRSPCRKKSILAEVCFDTKRGGMRMQRNEYLFKEVAICTNFWAIYSKI